jgi:hypothetical protein
MLKRHEIENYLFDKEIVRRYCLIHGTHFAEEKYDQIVTNIQHQDLKTIQQQIQSLCKNSGKLDTFKKQLAKQILPSTRTFSELEDVIFH